jgi:uncharacterized Zn finger protein
MLPLTKLYPQGWLLYCPDCGQFTKQSDPQNNSRRKAVVIDDEPCSECKAKQAGEVEEAQQLLGRLGLPKGEPCPTITNN